MDRSSRVSSLVISALLMVFLLVGCSNPVDNDGEFAGALLVRALTDLPAAGAENEGQLYYVIEEEQFYYSDGAAYVPIDLTGPEGPAGASLEWLGALSSHPADPQLNWAYYNTIDGTAYIWDGDSWEILAQDGQVAISLNAHGFVDPGDYLSLQHNLGRDDLTFSGQFVKDEYVYDHSQYRAMFYPHFRELVAATVFESAQVDFLAVAGLANGAVALAYSDTGNSSYGTLAIYDQHGNEEVAPTVFRAAGVSETTIAELSNGNIAIVYVTGGVGTLEIYNAAGVEVAGPKTFGSAWAVFNPSATALETGAVAVAYVGSGDACTLTVFDAAGDQVVAPTVIAATSSIYVSATTLSNGNIAVAYRDQSNSGYGTFVVSDPAGSVVVAPTVFAPGLTSLIRAVSLTNGNLALVHQDAASAGMLAVYGPSGDQVQSPTVVEPVPFYGVAATLLPDGTLGIAYGDGDNSNHGTIVVCDDRGDHASAPAVFAPVGVGGVAAATLSGGQLAVAYADQANSSFGTMVIHGYRFIAMERASTDEVRLWNRTDETLEMMLSVNQ